MLLAQKWCGAMIARNINIPSYFLLRIIILWGILDNRRHIFAESRTLTVCLLVERGTSTLFYNFDRSAAAVDLALQYANEVMLYNNNITLQSYYTDIGATCTAKNHIVTYAMDLMSFGVKCDVYIGPGCGSAAESLYDFTSAYRTLVIGCPAAGIGTTAPLAQYPFLTRISVTHLNTAQVLLQFLKQQNYTTPSIIEDQDNSFYQQMSAVVSDFLHKEAPALYAKTAFSEITSKTFTTRDAEKILKSDFARTRVFILLAPSDTVRKIMLTAHKLGMTNGEFVYWAVNLFSSATWGNFSYSYGDSFDEDARQAYQSLLIASLSMVQDTTFEIFSNVVRKLSAEKYNYTYPATDRVDIVTGHFYDSVIYYASMIKSLADSGSENLNGDELIDLYPGYSFTSPINGVVTMTASGDRTSAYILKNFNPDTEKFEEFISFPATGNFTILGRVRWVDGRHQLPPNTPHCGFLGNDPICDYVMPASTLVAAVAVPVTAVLLGVCAGIYLTMRYISSSTDPFWWRVFLHELAVTGTSSKSTTSSAMQSQNVGDTGTMISYTKTEMSHVSHHSVKTATYNGNLVGITDFPEPLQRVRAGLGRSLLPIRRVQHPNLQKFIGIAINDENLCEGVVGELCQKGTLTRLLERDRIDLDWIFKSSLIKDLINGMTYLHSTSITSHGFLSSNNCLIDSNFVLKICDYGLEFFRRPADLEPLFEEGDEFRDLSILFWRAPEFLRQTMPPKGSQKGDVYSYSIITQQIMLRSPPYRSGDATRSTLADKDILLEIKRGTNPPLRPRIPVSACAQGVRDLLELCWEENPLLRPHFGRIRELINKIFRKAGDNIVDHLISSMEKHAAALEHEADQRMKDFMDEKRRSDAILSQILPRAIAIDLANGRVVHPQSYPSTTVHFSDIDGFSDLIAASRNPLDTILTMNVLYSTCDAVIERFDVYKVESVKDQLMVVSGLPVSNGIRHADEIASMAIQLRRDVAAMKLDFALDIKLKLRVGLHSGSCVAGVIGTKMPRYCLFGDTVNTSSRMESHGEAGKIQCSGSTKDLLEQIGGFHLVSRGEINVKGKGVMETFWLIGKELV